MKLKILAVILLVALTGISQAAQPQLDKPTVVVKSKHTQVKHKQEQPKAEAQAEVQATAPSTGTRAPKPVAKAPVMPPPAKPCSSGNAFEAGVNAVRASHGLPALCSNAALRAAAYARANYMCQNNVFSHAGFYGQVAAMYSAPTGLIGENISAGLYPGGDAQVVQEFVNSPEHYENIVRADYKEQGAASITCNPPYCTAIGICGYPVPVQINVNDFGG